MAIFTPFPESDFSFPKMPYKFPFFKICALAFFACATIQHPTFGDSAKGAAVPKVEFNVGDNNVLLLPMNGSDEYTDFSLRDEHGNTICSFNGLLAANKPLWWAELDVSAFKGRNLALFHAPKLAPKVRLSQTPQSRDWRFDRARPAFHLTAKWGAFASVAGIANMGGVWNCLYLYNPLSLDENPPYWLARAKSKFLLDWQYESEISAPKFSAVTKGAAYIKSASLCADLSNASGLFDSAKGGILAVFEESDGSVGLMSSPDMAAWHRAPFNPVLRGLSDPVLMRTESSWVLAGIKDGSMQVYVSENLREWEHSQTVERITTRFDIAEVPVVGNRDSLRKWVVVASDGRYFVGDFENGKFAFNKQPMRRIFYGDVEGVSFLRNDPEGRTIAVATVSQPAALMRDVGQSFSRCASLPWELRLVCVSGGEYQLRADMPRELKTRMSNPENAMGLPSMRFANNIFQLPDAFGNYMILTGQVMLPSNDNLILEAGVASFDYTPAKAAISVSRVNRLRYADNAQIVNTTGVVSFKMVVDTYDVELVYDDGHAVVIMGDSFINPDQQIRFGSVGGIATKEMCKRTFLSTTSSERLKHRARDYDNLKSRMEKPSGKSE